MQVMITRPSLILNHPYTTPIFAVVLVVLFYGAALGYGLVWDDRVWLNDFQHDDVATLLRRNLTGPTLASYYRPLVSAITTLQLALSLHPAFLHGLNLVLHVVNLLLFIALARRAATVPRPYLLALGVAALALHPMLVEPVVWVSGRFDLFYTTFLLLTLLAAVAIGSRVRRAATVGICFFLALCCKESALVGLWLGPLVLLCIARNRGATWDHVAWGRALDLFVTLAIGLAAYLGLRLLWLEIPLLDAPAFAGDAHIVFADRLLLVLRTLGTYFQMTVLPLWNLEPLHALSDTPLVTSTYEMLGAALILLALAAWRWPVLTPITLWTAALVPAANYLPLRLDLVQNRYLYLPLFAAGVAAVSYPWPARLEAPYARFMWAAAALWLLSAAATNLSISHLWRDDLRLFSWSVASNPGSPVALEHLALAHYYAGDYRQAIRIEQGLAEPARSFQGRVLLARALREASDPAGAARQFERALASPMNDPKLIIGALYELALLKRQLGDPGASARLAAAADALAAHYQVSARLRDYYRQQFVHDQ